MTGGAYFREVPYDSLRQGDIFPAPTSRMWRHASIEPTPEPVEPPPGESVGCSAWGEGSPLDPVVEVRSGLAMVVSHSCEIEKEFNREVRRLIEDTGLEKSEAVRRASDDPDLDRLVVVAPLRAYEEFPEQDHAGLRSGQRIGYIPLDDIPGLGVDMVVDLTELSTIERHLLAPERKLSSLSPEGVGELRYKLSEAYAIRGLSVIAELEAMVGQTIVGVDTTEKSRKKTALVIKLDDGSLLNLEIRKPGDELPEEVTRTGGSQE